MQASQSITSVITTAPTAVTEATPTLRPTRVQNCSQCLETYHCKNLSTTLGAIGGGTTGTVLSLKFLSSGGVLSSLAIGTGSAFVLGWGCYASFSAIESCLARCSNAEAPEDSPSREPLNSVNTTADNTPALYSDAPPHYEDIDLPPSYDETVQYTDAPPTYQESIALEPRHGEESTEHHSSITNHQ